MAKTSAGPAGKLVLASASARRLALLTEQGYDFEVRPADVPEEMPAECDDPAAVAERLAEAKARAVAATVTEPGRWVIGADTIVALGRRLIGKPRDAADAVAILRDLSGSRHVVITGLALVPSGGGPALVRHDVTAIRMGVIPDEEIRSYVASGRALGKAGAYALQEGGDRYVERIDGSPSNVVGLPMELLARMLTEVGYAGAKNKNRKGAAR